MTVRVEDAMRPVTIPVLDDDQPLTMILRQIENSTSENILVRLSPARMECDHQVGDQDHGGEKGRANSACAQFCPSAACLIYIRIILSRWLCVM